MTSNQTPQPGHFISKYNRDSENSTLEAIENVPGHERLPVICVDHQFTRNRSVVNTKRFAWFPSLDDVVSYVERTPDERCVFYEYVRGPQKFHIDIDVSRENMRKAIDQGLLDPEKEMPEVAFTCLAFCSRALVEISEQYYATKLTSEDLVICESHREGKFSWHITTARGYFPSNEHCKQIYNDLMDHAKNDVSYVHIFADQQVYSVKQQWRLLGSHKIGVPNKKQIMHRWPEHEIFQGWPPLRGDWTLKDTMLQYYGSGEIHDFPLARARSVPAARLESVELINNADLLSLCDLIDWKKRLSTRDEWLQALRAFHHEGKGAEDYLEFFDREICAKNWPQYDQSASDENHAKWSELNANHPKPTTAGTLRKWAKEDNPEAYDNWDRTRVFTDEELLIEEFILDEPEPYDEQPAEQPDSNPMEQPDLPQLTTQPNSDPMEPNPTQDQSRVSSRFMDWAINQILDENERGIARVLLRVWKRDLVFDGVNIHHWNRYRSLWSKDLEGLTVLSANDMAPFFAEMHRRFPPIEKGQDGYAERMRLIKTIKKRKDSLNTYNKSVQIGRLVEKFVRSEFEKNLEFPMLLDSKENLYPLKGKKIVDLLTGALMERTRDHFFTQEPPIRVGRDNPLIREVILADCCGDEQLYDYLHRVIGYTLTGYMSERKMFVLHGEGANGKSELLDLMNAMMRGYSAKAPDGLFVKRSKESASNARTEHLRPLIGNRLVYYSELSEGAVLDDALIKTITGGDVIAFRGAGEKTINFKPSAKLFLLTNHMPDLANVNDNAMLARLVCIPFNARFVENPVEENEYQANPDLMRQLKTEALDDFFYWALQGAREWHERGLSVDIPECVIAKKREYCREQNDIEHWFEERVDLETTQVTSVRDFYADYKFWLARLYADKKPKSMIAFGRAVKPLFGEERFRHRGSGNHYVGKFRNQSENNQ